MCTNLLAQFVSQCISHHGLPCAWSSVEQHDHSCPICDGVVQPQSPPAALECLKVADCVKNELLLLLAEDHLREEKEDKEEEEEEEEELSQQKTVLFC